MLLDLLRTDPGIFFLVIGILLFSLILHEVGHAVAALWSGDDTAKRMGRITLNPLKHLDPFGVIMLLIVGLGWARPVPFNPNNFRNYRVGLFFVAIAGIVVNLVIAVSLTILIRWLANTYPAEVRAMFQDEVHSLPGTAAFVAYLATIINLSLAVFNLLPIPPLDGSKILLSFLPARLHIYVWRLETNPNYAIVAMLLFLTVLRQPLGNMQGWIREQFFTLFGLQ